MTEQQKSGRQTETREQKPDQLVLDKETTKDLDAGPGADRVRGGGCRDTKACGGS